MAAGLFALDYVSPSHGIQYNFNSFAFLSQFQMVPASTIY